jgi:hypothetical protein
MRVMFSGLVMALTVLAITNVPYPAGRQAVPAASATAMDKGGVQTAAVLNAKFNRTPACAQSIPCVEIQRTDSSVRR